MIKALHIVGELTYDGISTWIETLIDAANKNELKIDILYNFWKGKGLLADKFQAGD